MRYRFEKEMTSIVIDWLQNQGLLIKREYQLPWGICDLVGISINRDKAELRKKLGQTRNIGSIYGILLLTEIPDEETGHSITVDKLANKMSDYSNYFDMQKELGKLINGKFVNSHRKNHFQKINGWMPLHNRIVSVELKIDNVKEAFYQALNHSIFATETYVAFPFKKAMEIVCGQNRNLFVDSGVGVLGVSKNACTLLLAPRTSRQDFDSHMQACCVERFWRQYQRQ